MRSHAGIILGMTKNDFDPFKNGLILWNDMALAAALYGTEVIHFKKQDIKELESIQANFLAHLLGQRTSVSHVAVREGVGVNPIEQILMDMKLNYWYHLTRSIKGSLLRAASKNIVKSVVKNRTKSHFNQLSETLIDAHRTHSLRAFSTFQEQREASGLLTPP